jgi:hypothetical protein
VRQQMQIDIPGGYGGGRFVGGAEREGFASALVGDFHGPILGESHFAFARVALAENARLPVADVGFGEVSKQTRCLDTFFV